MLDKTSSIICAFGLAVAAPRSPYRHLELCGIAQSKNTKQGGNHMKIAVAGTGARDIIGSTKKNYDN
jgi:hypothetical protein